MPLRLPATSPQGNGFGKMKANITLLVLAGLVAGANAATKCQKLVDGQDLDAVFSTCDTENPNVEFPVRCLPALPHESRSSPPLMAA